MSDETINDAALTLAQLLKDKGAPIYASSGHIYIGLLDDEGDE